MIEGSGSGSGSIPLTNGSGSRRPINTWIRIRIRNTVKKQQEQTTSYSTFFSASKHIFVLWILYVKTLYTALTTNLPPLCVTPAFPSLFQSRVRWAWYRLSTGATPPSPAPPPPQRRRGGAAAPAGPPRLLIFGPMSRFVLLWTNKKFLLLTNKQVWII